MKESNDVPSIRAVRPPFETSHTEFSDPGKRSTHLYLTIKTNVADLCYRTISEHNHFVLWRSITAVNNKEIKVERERERGENIRKETSINKLSNKNNREVFIPSVDLITTFRFSYCIHNLGLNEICGC